MPVDALSQRGSGPTAKLEIGDFAPLVELRDQSGQLASTITFDVCGSPIALIFHAGDANESLLEELRGFRDLYGALRSHDATVLAVTGLAVAANESIARAHDLPFKLLSDPSGTTLRAYGVDATSAGDGTRTFVLDPNLRIGCIVDRTADRHAAAVLRYLEAVTAKRHTVSLPAHPPVLVMPKALSGDDCRMLVETWHRLDAAQADAQTDRVQTEESKRFLRVYGKAQQYVVREPGLVRYIDERLTRRIGPELGKSFQTNASRREQYRLACYDSAEGGILPPHRDNVNRENLHRRFTLSVILNAGEFEGGELRFREYGDFRYNVETGTAVLWSASLLHEVLPVSAGRRFSLVTHLFDEWDRKREAERPTSIASGPRRPV